ncbi:hypothetical protein C8R44DRAFT_869090 [Mycena epipterygia]|nr:hypothetical protein C8R44DRAFT_869090 [Mycena epipterygia]
MVAFTLLLPLLFVTKYVPAIATKYGVAIRQAATSDSDSDCTNECSAFDNEDDTCNNTVITDAATCYSCMIKAGTMTQEVAQENINEFVSDCDNDGQTVTNITITAGGSTPAGSGSSSAPSVQTSAPAVKPTTTPSPTETDSEKESPTETDSTDSPDATDSAGNSSASASASGSSAPGASGAAANAGDGVGLTTKSAAVMSAVLVVLSAIVTIGGL